MTNIQIFITSAFCKDGAGGNKAGIVFDHPELDSTQKMKISKKLGLSETAFVTKSAYADYKLEYYTPTDEVPLCGRIWESIVLWQLLTKVLLAKLIEPFYQHII